MRRIRNASRDLLTRRPFKISLIFAVVAIISLSIASFYTDSLDYAKHITSPGHWVSSCSNAISGQDIGPTNLTHIFFALAGSAATWQQRKHYTDLWWDRNTTRGVVWLDDEPPVNSSTASFPPYRVSLGPPGKPNRKPSDRIARLVKESFELGSPDVRWFVMGDDDTVFMKENLVTVLAKYDHRQMYYVGGPSESVEQDDVHSYDTAFGGGGFAISHPLACELAKILDGCIERYHNFYGSDEKVAACVAEIGAPLTIESGFHQLDIGGDAYGFLAAHKRAPLLSLHHLDHFKPLFPNQSQEESLRTLMRAYKLDPGRTFQQSFCYDKTRKWSVSVSWGYTAQLYTSLIAARELEIPLRTFRTWRSGSDGPFVFNTRPLKGDPCQRPLIYFLDWAEEIYGGNMTLSMYKRSVEEAGKKCGLPSYKDAFDVENILVSALKMSPQDWLKAPRRQCCEIKTDGVSMKMDIRKCRPGESVTI